MSDVVHIHQNHLLVGNWVASDGFSDVVVSITTSGDSFSVVAADKNDGKQAEVYNIKYDGDCLKFSIHWPSNGRFVKYSFLLSEKGTVQATYTYSGQEIWQKLKS